MCKYVHECICFQSVGVHVCVPTRVSITCVRACVHVLSPWQLTGRQRKAEEGRGRQRNDGLSKVWPLHAFMCMHVSVCARGDGKVGG